MLPTIQLPFGITLCSFTLMLGLAGTFFVCYVLEGALDRGLSTSKVLGFGAVGTVSGLLGARAAWFVFYDPQSFLADPWAFFTDDGGLCFFGTLLVGVPVSLAYLRAASLPAVQMLALSAPAIAVAHGIGRIGCLLGGCCYGAPAELPWTFAQPEVSGDTLARHPTQVYEMIVLFALGWTLHRLAARGAAPGSICRLYAAALATERFLMELLRGDTGAESVLLGLTLAQTICLGLAIVCLVTLRRPERNLRAPAGNAPGARRSSNAKIRVNA